MYEDSGYFDPSHDSNPIPQPQIDSPSQVPDYNSITNNGMKENLQIDLEDAISSIALNRLHIHDNNNNNNHISFNVMQEDMKGEVKGNCVIERLNEKYKALRELVPSLPKSDRASVVKYAIEYIKDLLRSVDELKILMDKKKNGRDMRRMLKAENDAAGDMESSSIRPIRDDDHPLTGALRCSWLHRRSKESFVDVHIIDNEVNIKLNLKKKPNCLVYIAKVLEDLQLDLVHLSGATIGDSYVFMLNTKICEGCSVYPGVVAKKFLEVMDRQYPTLTFPASY